MKKEVWQKCPVCNGKKLIWGDFPNPMYDNCTIPLIPPRIACPVCNGWGIISILTGLPPQSQVTDLTPLNNPNTENSEPAAQESDTTKA